MVVSNSLHYSFADTSSHPTSTGVYCIEHVASGKKYVGYTDKRTRADRSGFRGRWKEHVYELRRGKHKTRALQNAFIKYGECAFVLSVLEECTTGIEEREAYYIKELGTLTTQHGYNQYSCSSGKRDMSPETRLRISEAQRAREPMSEATRQKIRKASLGRQHTEETKARLRYPRPRSKEHALALAKAKVGNIPFRLFNPTTNERWEGFNLTAFAKERGLSQGCLSLVAQGKRNYHKGWVRVVAGGLN